MIVVKQTRSVLNKVLPNAVNPLSGSDTPTKANPDVVTRNRAFSQSSQNDSLQRNGSIGRNRSIGRGNSKSKSRNHHSHRHHNNLTHEAIDDLIDNSNEENKSNGRAMEVSVESKDGNFKREKLTTLEWTLICIIAFLLLMVYMIT
ncbi:hypothetical protein I9W82_003180 [Candida metapsilosis]|uniref:Uncharacterized protein n=1 Tax=Candida metapsilosis TaxID=273372 RepID=A0A8H7ZCP5_9ASCO|nr:hypothetical protein I9W82_003180 [Candida metapsilosis]